VIIIDENDNRNIEDHDITEQQKKDLAYLEFQSMRYKELLGEIFEET
jgi:hypothetical protein